MMTYQNNLRQGHILHIKDHFLRFLTGGIILFSFLLFTNDARGQKPTVEKVKNVLKNKVGFSAADLESLEKGNFIVTELDVETDGEIAFAGAIKLEAPRDIVFSAFRRAVERQRVKLAEERGFFKNPPTVRDMTKLKIKDSEVRSLKKCQPGDCDLSLSSEYIKRFTDEIDWDAPDAEKKAKKLYKEIMVEHLNNYLKNGNSALMDYNDDPEALSLSEEQKSLLEGLLWIGDFAPEFKDYLKNYPNKKLDGIEELATWEKIQVAFKEVIINSHGIFYKKETDGIPQGLIASKQIYANHFFHSSLSLTGIISFPKGEDKFDSYLFFVNHSRAGALTGTTGKLLSAAVDGEAENNLTRVLKDTKKYTAYGLQGGEEPEFEEDPSILQRIFGNTLCIGVIVFAILIVLVLVFTRKQN